LTGLPEAARNRSLSDTLGDNFDTPMRNCPKTVIEIKVSVSALSGVSGSISGMGHLLGYARVSTIEQDPALQLDALAAAGCARVWTDHASGALVNRPKLDELLAAVLPGDTLVVWKLDRLGRSLPHLLATVTDLADRQVGFRSLTEGIDTTTAAGRMVFSIFGALAEFERSLIRERTMAGLEAARARGSAPGRPTVMTPDRIAAARTMAEAKVPIARIVGVGRASVYRALEGHDSRRS
jgi:DNA invertase Pin-like site-specific DNA recombinase